MEQLNLAITNIKLMKQMYAEFEIRFQCEQALLSDFSNTMHEDAICFFNLNEIEKAQTTVFALVMWISRDVQYFISKPNDKKKLFEYDLVCSLQLMGQIINICEDFKQWDTAFTLQKEYAKLNIKYSIMVEAA